MIDGKNQIPPLMSKDKLPTVSIIIVNHNGKHHLKECLESLMAMNYPISRLELLLVDNGSSDGSVKFVQQNYPNIKIITNAANLGFAKANNLGAKEAIGDYIALLNNDMRVDSEWLLTLVESVRRSDTIVCAGSKILNWDGTKIDFVGGGVNFYGYGFQTAHQSDRINDFDTEQPLLFACGGAMIIKRDVYLEVGGFDDDYFAFFEDVDLGWRLWILGYEVVFSPKSLVFHRHHGTAASLSDEKKVVLFERNALSTIIKNYERENLDRILPAALMLANRRALIALNLHRQRAFRIEGDRQSTEISELKTENVTKRFSRIAKEEGTIGKTVIRFAKGISMRVHGFLADCLYTLLPPYRQTVGRCGISIIIAVDDVAKNLPAILKKRDFIQAKRRRKDEDIFNLFGDPFQPTSHHDDFIAMQEDLIDTLGLRDIFKDRQA